MLQLYATEMEIAYATKVNVTSKTENSLPLILLFLIFASLLTPTPAAAGAAQAAFIRTDTTTQGNWKGVYGADGYFVADTTTNKVPSYAVFTPQNQANWTWTSNGTEMRDLQVSSSSSTNVRQASCWYTLSNNTYSLDVNITDGNAHQLALYVLDWDNRGRAETIQAVDGTSGAVLDTRSLANFTNGIYYVWNVSGHVTFNVTLTGGLNAVVSGAFFDAGPANSTSATAHFINTDTTTEGNWPGAYGADGYNMMGVNPSMPSYAVLTPQNALTWTWAASSTDPRALELVGGSGRIAATRYSGSTFSIDVNTTDGNAHQIALYAVDWDSRGRAETIQVVDAQTNAQLDSRSISNFVNGIYVVWSISGHVTINVTNNSGPNAVVSGVLFGAGGSVAPPTTPTTTSPTTPTTSGAALPSGLVLHWTFDTANISGTAVTDTSNHGGTGTLSGNPVIVAGKLNQALAFNGVNSYVSMSAYADLATSLNNSVTLAAWINTTNAARTESIISKYSAGGSGAGYLFETDASGHLEFKVGSADIYSYPAGAVDTASGIL